MIYRGSCHCGAIQFEIEAAGTLEVEDCNCSICSKTGYLHLILPLSKFKLISGQDHIHTYTFNSAVAKHTFCSICGIKAFYTPRSNPDGVDVNLRCLDSKPESVSIKKFDGQHWEEHAQSLAPKSLD